MIACMCAFGLLIHGDYLVIEVYNVVCDNSVTAPRPHQQLPVLSHVQAMSQNWMWCSWCSFARVPGCRLCPGMIQRCIPKSILYVSLCGGTQGNGPFNGN